MGFVCAENIQNAQDSFHRFFSLTSGVDL